MREFLRLFCSSFFLFSSPPRHLCTNACVKYGLCGPESIEQIEIDDFLVHILIFCATEIRKSFVLPRKYTKYTKCRWLYSSAERAIWMKITKYTNKCICNTIYNNKREIPWKIVAYNLARTIFIHLDRQSARISLRVCIQCRMDGLVTADIDDPGTLRKQRTENGAWI